MQFKSRFKKWYINSVRKGLNFSTYTCKKNEFNEVEAFPHQNLLECITPNRFDIGVLLNYMTGSGKTRSLVKILNSCFYDKRAKLFLCPSQQEIKNFIFEILIQGFNYENGKKKKKQKIIKDKMETNKEFQKEDLKILEKLEDLKKEKSKFVFYGNKTLLQCSRKL